MKKKYSKFVIYALTWIALFIGNVVSGQNFSDNASNYGGSWGNNSNHGSGFGAWVLNFGTQTGSFIGNPANNGMETSGIGTTAFGMFATGSGYFNAYRSINGGIQVGDTFSFYWAMNWDAQNGSKGFDLKSGGNTIFNVNNTGNAIITTTNGTANANYGTNPMFVSITRVNLSTYSFSMTSRSGDSTYNRTINNSATIDGFEIYIGNQNDGSGQRNMYFNNFMISKPITIANGNWNVGSTWLNNSIPIAGATVTIANSINITNSIETGNLTIQSGASLTLQPTSRLKVNGNITNNAQIIFKSDATGSGAFDAFLGTLSGSGTVQVERYIPARRAFRFLTSSVTTSGSVRDNWQENGGTAAGLGTHITGTGAATDGFDFTATNNPSMFGFNHNTGQWSAVTNTNINTLIAGTPYRLMVRGDRTTDLSTNTPNLSITKLRATGALHTGNFTPSLNQAPEGFSFIGNPYQAPLDMQAVLTASTNINSDQLYYWDPTLNARGAYVARTLSNNTNVPNSNFTEILQPGQAVFVKNTSNGNPTMTIEETHKAVTQGVAGVFRTSNTLSNVGMIRVNLQANVQNAWQTIEGTLAIFNDNYSWAVTQEDATKMSNLDEEVSFVQNDTSLAIACVSAPSANSELPIQLNNLRHSNYQWQFELTNYQGERPYLYDTQNNTYTEITNGATVPFTATTAAANRFKIVFQPSALNADDFTHGLVLYPNPAKAGDSFYVQGSTAAEVTVYNVLGQHIPVQVKSQGNALQVTPTQTLSQGIYLVTVRTEGKTQHIKWIVE